MRVGKLLYLQIEREEKIRAGQRLESRVSEQQREKNSFYSSLNLSTIESIDKSTVLMSADVNVVDDMPDVDPL